MAERVKLLFIPVILAALAVTVSISLGIKDLSIRELYEDVSFMRITMEARRYVSQIEYGIKNGRQLDNFYNMQETLQGIQRCSSYMEGAYIVSSSGKLLYQSGVKADTLELTIPMGQVDPKGRLYTMTEDMENFYLAAPIRSGNDGLDGYLLMCIGKNSVTNAVSEYNFQNRVQSMVILLEISGIALLVLKRLRSAGKSQMVLKLLVVLSVAVVSTAAMDSGMVIARFYQTVDDAARQSANKMAQALQSEVDAVVAKGVSAERIYDLNGWLAKNSSELTIVTSLTLDRNHKITANVSQAYINSFFHRFLIRTALLVLGCMVFGLVSCGTAVLLGRKNTRKFRNDRTRGIANA